MLAAIFTTLFFALSVSLARRSSTYVGAQPANMARQVIALVVLGGWAHLFGQGLHGVSVKIMFVSGVVGFGVGDWALFEALPRIGTAMTILMCQCLAAPIAALTEWLWLGTTITGLQIVGSVSILVGVALAVAPGHGKDIPVGHRMAGIAFGVLAAAGQGWGAVLSRFGFLRAHENGFVLDGMTAAYQRLCGGVITLGVIMIIHTGIHRHIWKHPAPHKGDWVRGWPWMVGNAFAGPIVGVSCYLLALKAAPSALVLPIVATTPLVAMLLAYFFEGVKPSGRAVIGSAIAVIGVVVLVMQSSGTQ